VVLFSIIQLFGNSTPQLFHHSPLIPHLGRHILCHKRVVKGMKVIGTHEALELHELLMFKNTCLAKSMAMRQMVSDPQLKSLIEQDIQKTTQHILDLQNLLS